MVYNAYATIKWDLAGKIPNISIYLKHTSKYNTLQSPHFRIYLLEYLQV